MTVGRTDRWSRHDDVLFGEYVPADISPSYNHHGWLGIKNKLSVYPCLLSALTEVKKREAKEFEKGSLYETIFFLYKAGKQLQVRRLIGTTQIKLT